MNLESEWLEIMRAYRTKREAHLEALLKMALPYLERDELGTNTSQYTRHLIAEIKQQTGVFRNETHNGNA